MGHIFFLARTYSPNAASDIRYRSFLGGFKDADVTFVYVLPDEKKSKLVTAYANVKVVNLWEENCPSNNVLKHIFFYRQLLKFVFSLKKGDSVVCLACCEMLPVLFLNRQINVFYEVSEHPEISLCSTRVLAPSVKRFLSECRHLTGMFVISQALKDYFINNGIDSWKIHVINMTVDASRFESLSKTEGRERYIAYCGTASNNKDGVNQLIESFANVAREVNDIKLYIIGSTPDRDQEFSNGQLVEPLGIKDRVVFTGSVPYNKVPQLLMDAEIVALDRPDNKQAKYGFPTKLGEYLMTGNPVVITRVGDIPLFLSDRVNAIIAEPDNVASFSECLLWALNNHSSAKEIGLRGREVAKEKFNGVIEGRKIIDIINS